MPISSYPVVVPYRAPGATGALSTLQVNAIAEDAPTALAEARLIASHWARLHAGSGVLELVAGRIKCGTPEPQPNGPNLYVMSRVDSVHAVSFPARIDSEPGERLGETLAGFEADRVHAVVFACQRLSYINTIGLTALAAHVKRLPLHLCAVPEPVQRVFDIVGLTRYLSIHRDLASALAAVRPAG
jgi:anti-anti-sigma regulatory factor